MPLRSTSVHEREGKHEELEAQVVNGQLARGQCQAENTGPCSWNSTAISSKESIPEEAMAQK